MKDNLTMFTDHAEEEEIHEAIHAACLDELVAKIGMDAKLGERGIGLSEGQAQRLAIARALLSKAPILLLDEATSALDSISEAAIQAAINPLIEERTSILIAHRLSTILAADEILVVRDGEIVERGKHKDLVHAGGTYQELYETQFSKAAET
jgi:ATP-binding cassette subfamily B protein